MNKTEELLSAFATVFYENTREEESREWIDDHYEPDGSEWVIENPVAFWDSILKACKESGLKFVVEDDFGDIGNIEDIDATQA